MSSIERTVHEAACNRLSLAFAAHVDARAFQQASALFCADAVWDHVTGTYRAPKAIYGALAALPADMRTRHFVTNINVELIAEGVARGRSYVMLYQGAIPADGLPVCATAPVIAENEDEYRQLDGSWKILLRTTRLTFAPSEAARRLT
jgi:hypothetical protein